ncbi:MAG TPA: flavoprotein [Pseudonocardiaceae bacterium]|nr:flavoprotein [Pseudonocardiaceae bacterium]
MTGRPVVYVIGGAAPPIFDIEQLLQLLREHGWQPCLILTPTAANWINVSHFGELAGCPIRTEPRLPGEEDSLPMANAVLTAPLTFNTTNKWAAGINDTLALGVLNELLSEDVSIVAAPCVKAGLRKHPSYSNSCGLLADCGVLFLDPEETVVRRDDHVTFKWHYLAYQFEAVTRH